MSTGPLVLVVDTDPVTHELVHAALAEDDCLILTARSAAAAMKIAERRLPAVLVADLDCAAPLRDLVARLHALTPMLRVMLVLPPGRSIDEVGPLAAQGPYVSKPLDASKVKATVRSLVRLHGMASDVDTMRKDSAGMTAGGRRPMSTTRRDGPKKG